MGMATRGSISPLNRLQRVGNPWTTLVFSDPFSYHDGVKPLNGLIPPDECPHHPQGDFLF